MAMANVLLPSLVRLHFPDRIGLVTAIYTTALVDRADRGARADRADRRRARRLALRPRRSGRCWPRSRRVPWLGAGPPTTAASSAPAARRAPSATSPAPGWAGRWRSSSASSRCRRTPSSAGSPTLWRDTGFGATDGRRAGRPASPAPSIPLSLWLPHVLARARRPALGALPGDRAATRSAYVGLMVAPHGLALLWAVVLGVGADDLPADPDPDRAARPHPRAAPRRCRRSPSRPAT